MKPFARFALGIALTALAAAPPAGARPPVPLPKSPPGKRIPWDSKKFMHVAELRPGMRGYALTVFKGTKIDKFGIEILGVVNKFNEGKDYILFRALDGPPVTRGLGIAHGMSGSPIYINGRLVGAISMGIPGTQFAKDPIALATPIEDMFDAWSPDLPKTPSSLSASPPIPSAGGTGGGALAQGQNFQPIAVPLMVSGMSGRSLARLRDSMAPFHFQVMAGGGAGGVQNNPLAQGASLLPGSAVGVSLVQGDIDLTATGTVTYRDGKRLLLFGHPLAGLGPIDAALTTAYVVDIFPSYQDSIKIGSPIKTVGRIFQDRPFSVGGVIGPMPQMIPMTVSVNDESIKRRKDFHVRIINHPLLTAQYVTAIAGAAIEQVHGQPGDSVAQVTMDVDVEEIGHVKRTNTFYDALGIDQTATGDLDSLMHLLSSNPFYPLAVKSVKMSVTIQNRHDTAEIDHIFLKDAKLAPGDTVDIGVVLKPYKRPAYTRMIAVKIPSNTPDGALTLTVRGGGSGGAMQSLLGGLFQIRASEPVGTASTVKQLVKQFEDKPLNNQLVARLLLPTSAITVKGEKLSGLPPTLAGAMQSARTTGLRLERDEVKTTETVPYIVSGSQSLSVTVLRKNLTEAPAPAASPSGGTSAPGSAPPASGTSDPPVVSVLSSPDDAIDGDDAAAGTAQGLPSPRLDSHPTVVVSTAPQATTTSATADAADADKAATKAADTKAADPKTASSPSGLKPVGRLPSVWRQGTEKDFESGNLTNVSVTSLGDIRLSPALEKVASTTESYIWAMQPDGKGSVYLGTGDDGLISKMDATGKITPFFKTGELEVTSLALDSDGTLYAGTAPNGRVFRVSPDGKGAVVFTAEEKYITALLLTGPHELAVATGGGTGRVYRKVTDSTVKALPANIFTSPEANILSLASDKDGSLYAGAGPDGILYKITSDGKSRVYFDAPEPNLTALTLDSKGNVYAGTSSLGTVYRVAPDGTSKRLLGRDKTPVLSLKADAADAVYACTGGTVYKINPDETVQSYAPVDDEQFLSLAVDPASRAVYAGTGTVGSVYKIGAASGSGLQGTFQSTVHDAGARAKWGTLAWTPDTPAGTRVWLQTRTGDTERPDDSWSAWSDAYTSFAGQPITSPPGRYIQYQATLTGDAAAAAAGSVPKLEDVSLYYLPRNQPPTLTVAKPKPGDAVSKTAQFQWSASDPDKDTLSYDVSYSADNGKIWTPITTRARLAAQTTTRVTFPTSPAAKAAATASQANLSQVGKEVPPAVRAKILAQVAAATAAIQAQSATPKAAVNLKETSFSWDTTQVPDGVYRIQVIASDRPSNPGDPLTAKAMSAPFLIANTAPTLTLETPVVKPDKSVVLTGSARTPVAFVKAVQGKAAGGDPVAAQADDALFDSPSERFTLTLPALSSGPHPVEVQVLDEAGNTATKTVMVNVP